MLYTAPEICRRVGERVRTLRLARGLSQSVLAERAGVSFSTYRRLEATGQVSFADIVRTAIALRAEDALLELFPAPEYATLNEALKQTAPGPRRAPRRRKGADECA
ncbi:helix-turn-helix domain-containing protein [Rhodospirillum centenum]|uniref:DNA-binding protein, putative n=1 Tax=Rhodospirillum centenum (strain ATCC 51521 / SW) TaxID=414684 RepID=B6IRP8_RHOCS|nr:helix-turn-helix transcriptional regulator [Rhodospirillum centenum]ACI98134.1 DNA-binding protein, putative [Rhodospirillum centenum SW]